MTALNRRWPYAIRVRWGPHAGDTRAPKPSGVAAEVHARTVLRVAAALPTAELHARAYVQAAGGCHRPRGVVAVVWGATAFMVPEEPRLPSRFAERSRVNDGERAILALGAGLVTAGLLMARRNRE